MEKPKCDSQDELEYTIVGLLITVVNKAGRTWIIYLDPTDPEQLG